MALIATSFVTVARTTWTNSTTATYLVLAGGTAWVLSQLLERVQWDGDVKVDGYMAMMINEEVFEMIGSTACTCYDCTIAQRQSCMRSLLPSSSEDQEPGTTFAC